MADSLAILDDWIARLRKLGGPEVARDVAKEAAPGVDQAVKATARAGQTPMGVPWKAKKDGGAPLVHASDHISTSAQGPIVYQTLTGPDVFHHKGLGGRPTRRVIPDALNVPPAVWRAVHQAADRVFRRLTRGR